MNVRQDPLPMQPQSQHSLYHLGTLCRWMVRQLLTHCVEEDELDRHDEDGYKCDVDEYNVRHGFYQAKIHLNEG
ncbi:hypothetical protein WG66_016295 [Moniliophthora roreri]|nr:hypothetical protein WG66_016295 [Moniliophthora roreri]